MNSKIEWIPIGGLGEVGMNNMLIKTDQHSFLLDCGTASSHSPWLGYDSVAPDYRYIFGENNLFPWPDDILLSHGHEDHIGGLPLFLKHCPKKVTLHATPFSAELIRKKLSEYPSLKQYWDLQVHKQTEEFLLGPWRVKYFFNNHSIYDSNCILMNLEGFKVFHTGDFRIDKTTYKDPSFAIEKVIKGEGPIDLMMADSTNAERQGWSLSEGDIGDQFDRVIASSQKAVVVSLFASNVRRLQHIIEAARASGRKLCFMGRSMEKFVDLAQVFDVFQIKENERIGIDDIGNHPRNSFVLFCTGSQGEYQAALSRIVHDQFKNFHLEAGDTFIHSALQIPGNELKVRNLFNRCVERGVNIIRNDGKNLVHTTGHAYAEELKESIAKVRPKSFLPVHGDGCMLNRHAELAKEASPQTDVYQIINASSLSYDGISYETIKLAEDLPKAWTKFKFSGSVSSQEIRDKKKIAREGLVNFVFDMESLFTHNLRASLLFVGCHFLEDDPVEEHYILERIRQDFYHQYDSKIDVEKWFNNWLRAFFKKRFGQRPVIKIDKIK
ncbi:MAG: ribonuclease J [Bdellovibrionota bacterium]|nr:ribonuclease J [Bdellovibrionota bacterium]